MASASEANGAVVTITLAKSAVVAPPVSQPVYRFWSPVYHGHFFTMSVAERDHIIATYPNVWSYEGERYKAFSTQVPGSVPLYRFWSPVFNGHFFTTDEAEKNSVIARYPNVWSFEGVAYYVYPVNSTAANTVTVARFWSETYKHHFYTADAAERDATKRYPAATWNYEGDNFRVPIG